MRATFLLPLLALAALVFVGSGAVQAQEPQGEQTYEHSPLEDAMETIKGGVRKLRRSLRSADKDADSLATLAEMQASALVAKQEKPRMTGSLPEADQAAFVVEYRKEMIALVQSLLNIESALLEGNREAASAAFDAMRGMEDPAHERFMQDE